MLPFMVRQLLVTAFLGAYVLAANALLPAQYSIEVAIDFASGSSELVAAEREKLASAIDQIRVTRWCDVRVAIAIAYADAGEAVDADAQRLSEERAHQVAVHLVELGLSPGIVYSEGRGLAAKGDAFNGGNVRARVEIAGSPPSAHCPNTTPRNGFWR